jgi:hypothetical protein
LGGIWDISGYFRASGADSAPSLASLPSITLSGDATGQIGYRLQIDVSGLRTGRSVVVPVSVTNAGNEALSSVGASLVSNVPGLKVMAQSQPVEAGATVKYDLLVTEAAGAVSYVPSQVVVALTPRS